MAMSQQLLSQGKKDDAPQMPGFPMMN